jgi:hypothetical protein
MSILPAEQPWWHLQRAALWNPAFYRFFGSEHGRVPSEFRPMSGDEGSGALSHIVESSGGEHPYPWLFRACLTRMWFSGYRPQNGYKDVFDRLAKKAFGKPTSAAAFEALVEWGRNCCGVPPSSRGRADQRIDVAAQLAADEHSHPAVATFDGNVWTVTKQCLLLRPIDRVKTLLDPQHWPWMAPCFKDVRRVALDKPPDDQTGAWRGVVEEKAVFNWNEMTLQEFDTFLKIDYTVTDEVVRVDYALEYEKDNQIVVDDGYGEARRITGGQTRYTGYKRVRFASSLLNFVAPAFLCMAVEQDEDGLRAQLERGTDALSPPAKPGSDQPRVAR